MEKNDKHSIQKIHKKKEQHIAEIVIILQSATLDQLEELKVFIKSYIT